MSTLPFFSLPCHPVCLLLVEAQQGKSWSAAKHTDQSVRTMLLESCKYLPKHADQSVRTGVLRHTSYTTYTLRNVPNLQGLSVAKTIRNAKTIKLLVMRGAR